MKFFLILLICTVVTIVGKTQQATSSKTMMWSIGVQPSVPVGEFTAYSGFGLGGSVQGEYKPSAIGITLNAGYIDYFGKTVNGYKYADFSYIPVLAGVKFYMGSSSKTYLHAQVGPGFGMNGLGTSFWYGAGIGLNFSKSVDAELGYMGWKQSIISNNGSTYNGTTGTGVGGTGGGGYGGHYPTFGIRLGFGF